MSKRWAPYVFLAPFLIMFIVFWITPIAQSLYLSFHSWNGLTSPKPVGLDNYRQLATDTDFRAAVKNTVSSAVVYDVVMVILAIVLGFLLNYEGLKGKAFFRTAFFLPVTMSLIVVALVFLIIFGSSGVLNQLLRFIGLDGSIDWLGDTRLALWSIVATRVWRAAGYYAIFILAGLQAIPPELLEASKVDGASAWQSTWYVIIPQLKPIITYVVVVSSIWAFQLFEEPWVMTQGGPMNATITMSMHLYRNAFQYFKLGYASAISCLMTLVILLFALVQMWIFREQN